MVTHNFDFETVFAPDDYLYFYHARLAPERSDVEVELLWQLLGLQPTMAVLDLACGHGRITNRLALRGCRVAGLDSSPAFLALGRQAAATSEQQGADIPDYLCGDMRYLPWCEQFDGIISWFSAYGYFDDEDNRKVLFEAQRALKPRGKLLLELNNRDFILSHFQRSSVVEREGSFLLDQSQYDVASGRLVTHRTVLRDGQTKRMRFFVRLFTFTELRDWLRAAGFARIEAFNERGTPLTLESQRMLVIATK